MDKGGFKKIYVYDVVLRILHALLAASTSLLIVTGIYAASLNPGPSQLGVWSLHTGVAKLFSTTILLRIIWALLGPRWALWPEFWHWNTWFGYLKTWRRQVDAKKIGHDPYAALAYLVFYLVSMGMIVSGWMLAGITYGSGPLADQLFDNVVAQEFNQMVHNVGFWLTSVFVVVHIVGLIMHERRYGRPISQAMVSGYQYTAELKDDK